MSVAKQARYMAEYLGVRLARALIIAIPHRIVVPLAHGIGTVAFKFSRVRRGVAIDNILRAGITADSVEAASLARDSYRHFAVMAAETIIAERRITPENWQEYVEIEDDHGVMAMAREPGRGMIMVTAHFGNWEAAAQVMSFIKPVVAVARRMNNPYTNRLIQQRKTAHDFRTIEKHTVTGKALLDTLRDGNILAMLIDQHARYRGMPISFMGRPAAMHTAPAVLHLRSGAPLGFAYCVRTGPLRYRLHFSPPLLRGDEPRDEGAIRTILEAITREMEAAVRRWPRQYLWAHRRWRLDKTTRARGGAAGLATATAAGDDA